MELRQGAPVVLLERLRFVDGEPWVLVTTYLPYDVAPGLVDDDLATQSLYALLETKYDVQLTHGRRSVEAALANDVQAGALAIKVGEPVLVLRSTVVRRRRPVEMFVAYHRGDRSRFEVALSRSKPASGKEPLMRSDPVTMAWDRAGSDALDGQPQHRADQIQPAHHVAGGQHRVV